MAISPLSSYQFNPIRPKKRKLKASSLSKKETDISSIFKSIETLEDPSLSVAIDDPNTAWSYWAEKDFFHDPFDEKELEAFINNIELACDLNKIYKSLPRLSTNYFSRYFRSFKHLTLPESLLYYYLLENKLEDKSLLVKLTVEKKPAFNTPLILHLSLENDKKNLHAWTLIYNLSTLTVQIKEKSSLTGKIRYIIRGKRLEEIEGTYKNKPFLLDPVWNPKKRLTLKEEHLKFGNFKTTLSYYRNEKYALYRNASEDTEMKVNKIKHFIKDTRTVITEKVVNLGDYVSLNRLIFAKGYIIPISGQFYLTQHNI
jgi:hypothetical protein